MSSLALAFTIKGHLKLAIYWWIALPMTFVLLVFFRAFRG